MLSESVGVRDSKGGCEPPIGGKEWCWDKSREEESLLLGNDCAVGLERAVLRNSQAIWSVRLFRVMKSA